MGSLDTKTAFGYSYRMWIVGGTLLVKAFAITTFPEAGDVATALAVRQSDLLPLANLGGGWGVPLGMAVLYHVMSSAVRQRRCHGARLAVLLGTAVLVWLLWLVVLLEADDVEDAAEVDGELLSVSESSGTSRCSNGSASGSGVNAHSWGTTGTGRSGTVGHGCSAWAGLVGVDGLYSGSLSPSWSLRSRGVLPFWRKDSAGCQNPNRLLPLLPELEVVERMKLL